VLFWDDQTDIGDQLFDWSERFHLSADWLLRVAFETLSDWAKNDIPLGDSITKCPKLEWAVESIEPASAIPDFGERATFGFRTHGLRWFGPAKGLEKIVDFRERVTAEFNEALDEYLLALQPDLQNWGWLKTPDKRAIHQHVKILVRYQVLGENWSTLSQGKGNKGREKKAAADLARQIGIDLRQSTRGRPRSRKSKI
jgi:hypothetical protein